MPYRVWFGRDSEMSAWCNSYVTAVCLFNALQKSYSLVYVVREETGEVVMDYEVPA